MTLTFKRYGSTATTDTLELDETKSSIIDKLNEPTRLSAILTSETAPQIALGNYTTYKGTRYYVTKEPTVRKEHSQLYTVEVDLERSLGLGRITILANPVDHRTTFDYTATATEHLQLIVDCLNAKYEEVGLKWTRGAVHCKDTVKHIKYDGATVLGALQQIRETYETDIFADGETLSLGQVDDKTTALPLAYGKGKGLLSGLERHKHTDDTVPTRLYVTGTKRNMTTGRLTLERDVVLAVDPKSGTIERDTGGMTIKPDGRTRYRTDKAGQYIAEWSPTDKFAQSWTRFPTEATYTNEEIYPSHVSTIKTVTKVKDHYEVNSDFDYDKFRIAGEQMQVVFQTGNLAGRDFDAKYMSSTGRLAIVPKEEDDTTLPSETLCPKVGDQYIVTGIKLPDQYIREAERKLTDEALRHLIKLQETRYSYKADIDPVYLHNNHNTIAPQLAVGRYVRLTDQQIAIGDPYVRIVGKRTYLDRPYTPEIELSNEVEPRSELTRVLNELDRQDNGLTSILDRLRQSGLTLGELTEGVGELTLSAEEMRKHLETAEQALTGKLDSGAFAQWRTGDYANRQSSLDEELRKKLGSEYFSKWRADELEPSLAGKASTVDVQQSARDAIAEAIKRAGEMDKEIKVGGRNLIRNGSEAKRQCGEWATYLLHKPIEQSEPLTLSFDVVKVEQPPLGGEFFVSFFHYSNFRTFAWIKYEEGKKRYSVTLQALEYNYNLYGDKKDYPPDAVFIYPNDTYKRSSTPDVGCFTIANVKLERGTVATDWTPAPEDLDDSVSKVNTSLTSLASTLLDPDQGEISKLEKLLGKHSESFEELATHPLTVDENGFWRIWSVKDSQYVTTQYKSRGDKGDKGDKGEDGAKGDKGDTPNLSLDEQYRLVADGKLVSQQSLKGRDGEDAGRYLGRAKRIHPDFNGNYLPETDTEFKWLTAKEGDYVYLVGDAPNRGGDKDTYYIVREHKSNTVWEVYNIKGHTPRLTLDEQFHLLADGEMVSMQSLRGEAGHTPNIKWHGTSLVVDNQPPVDLRGEAGHSPKLHIGPDDYLYIDGAKQRYLRGPQGEAGHSPSAEEVLNTEDFKERLEHRVKQQVAPVSEVLKKTKSSFEKSLKEVDAWQTNFSLSVINDFKTANDNIASLKNVALTLQQKEDLGYLTTALRLKMAGGEGDKKTLEGLALQRYIALSGNGKDVTAYLASDALDAVLKAGVTGFGTRTEQEQVAIYHNGTGHLGNLHFAGNHIDFKTGRDDAPYLSIGAEESQFIDDFIDTARLVDTPVSVGTVTLSESSMVYERWVTVDNDGTRLTVSIDELEVETYRGARTRLTLDGKVLGEWRGVERYSHGGGGGIYIDPQYDEYPYKASNLSYERVVKAGSYRLRLEIEDATSGATATVKGLRVRRLYDTGRQQSMLTKSGLRLFGSPDRYLDVDYRTQVPLYVKGHYLGETTNPYIVRIKGGAKVDRLTVDELDMPGVPLCGASFDASGSQVKAFGKYANKQGSSRAQAVYYDSGRFFRVYHSIGHTNYLPTVQVIGDNGNDINWNLTARIYAVNANDFAVRIITNGDNPIRHAFSFVAFKTM